MATDYFSDNDAYISNQPLPSPSDTPYTSLSRRTSRYGTPLSDGAASPVSFSPDASDTASKPTHEEDVSILDPRRFTPTLHASLVSEILSLRRELDSKHHFIEDLETSLYAVRSENDNLTSKLSTSAREGRAVKGQLQQLEDASISALEEITQERDRLKEANSDLKDKLSLAQKTLRSRDDDSIRVHDLWARDKDAWAGEKRSLERRVHVSESRLKLLLEEIAIHEEAREADQHDSDGEELPRDIAVGPESDTGSVRSSPVRRTSTRLAHHSRNLSNSSFRSFGRGYRMSLMSGTGSEGPGRGNGISLADELVFDEEEEDLEELELDSDDFTENEMRAIRALESRQSMHQDEKAKRILGLSLENDLPNRDSLSTAMETEPVKHVFGLTRIDPVATQDIPLVFPPPEPLSIETRNTGPRPQYVDTGVQPSPPPSPVRPETSESSLTFRLYESNSSGEVEANQRRKRVSAPSSPPAPPSQAPSVPRLMTSASSQTSEPLSPPATPKVATQFDEASVFPPQVVSIATQTDPIELPTAKPTLPLRATSPTPITIPSIAIHAPTSAPASPKEPILPPGTKSIATQTTNDMNSNMRTVGMQTEPIRIDKRPVKLPPHLLPSAVSSKPGTPEPGQERQKSGIITRQDSHQPIVGSREKGSTVPSARQDLMALLEKVTDKIEDRYPGNNDNGPLARGKESSISRPFRTSSLFAGFDGPSSDEDDIDGELSDEETRVPQYSMPMLSSRNVKNGRIFNNPPTPVPEEKETSPARPSEDSINSKLSTRSTVEKPAKVGKAGRTSISRQPSIRRSAMIHNGTTAHMRSRSPSIGSMDTNAHPSKPPFPVPTRSSSRMTPLSKSEGSQSPTIYNASALANRRPYGARQHQRKDSLRKVRSAAVIQKGRPRSRSPPLPATPTIPPSPSLPPIPNDMVAGQSLGHRHQLSTNTTHTGSGSVGSSIGYQANVVDAIAATMVGEWMWKYVRKRKAFGGQDSSADVARASEEAVTTSNGVRHKRWVWISPYERSVLWSSKQPTTGPALMGKSGRKRKYSKICLSNVKLLTQLPVTIQSVLDVTDNTPIPRNAGTQALFNRSILILTPARALKFTTVSRERHYLWLTALSFLAHSGSPIPELGPAPLAPPPVEEPSYRPVGATLRRSHVRDSVRLAKGKANPVAQRYQSSMEPMPSLPPFRAEQPLPDSADPPTIPRGPVHGRKRSSTGPGAPPPSVPFRTFSHQHAPSIYSSGSSDMYSSMHPPSVPSSVYNPHSVAASTRTSEASNSTRQHFFDTMGTVRMEAFIDDSLGKDPSHRTNLPASRFGRRRGSQWSASTNDPGLRGGGLYEDFMVEHSDPFRGF